VTTKSEMNTGMSGMRDLLESASDAIIVIGRDGRIRLVNRQAERVFGYAREELLGQLIEMMVPARRMTRPLVATVRQRKRFAPTIRPREESFDASFERLTPPPPANLRVLHWRDLELDPFERRVLAAGVDLQLRRMEFRLLSTFLESPGRVFTRDELLQLAWGAQSDGKTRTVDTHIRRLRARLGVFGDAIETVHGVGYGLRAENPIESIAPTTLAMARRHPHLASPAPLLPHQPHLPEAPLVASVR
jgi:DNA-binding winged helix-turn-helix (wHTH) protein